MVQQLSEHPSSIFSAAELRFGIRISYFSLTSEVFVHFIYYVKHLTYLYYNWLVLITDTELLSILRLTEIRRAANKRALNFVIFGLQKLRTTIQAFNNRSSTFVTYIGQRDGAGFNKRSRITNDDIIIPSSPREAAVCNKVNLLAAGSRFLRQYKTLGRQVSNHFPNINIHRPKHM